MSCPESMLSTSKRKPKQQVQQQVLTFQGLHMTSVLIEDCEPVQ